jgi:hypothetical protein
VHHYECLTKDNNEHYSYGECLDCYYCEFDSLYFGGAEEESTIEEGMKIRLIRIVEHNKHIRLCTK